MRILMLGSKEYPFGSSAGHDRLPGGGIEAHVDKLSKYLAKRGHDVFIITRQFPGQANRECHQGVHVIRVPYIRSRHLRGFSYNFTGFLAALQLIRRERIEIIHCHAVIAGFFGSLLSRLTGRPMIFTPHGTVVGWGFPFRQTLNLLQRYALGSASRIILISESERGLLSDKGPPSTLLTNAVDPDDYSFPLPNPHTGSVRFLFLGRLEPVKGVEETIQAFFKVMQQFPDSSLVIAGNGSLKNRVIDLVLEANSPGIKYMGWMNSRQALASCDCFVLPTSEKGQPVALLEAMSSGRIIITSHPFIKPGVTGISCKSKDVPVLSRAMLSVCSDPSRFLKLCSSAREEARSFSWSSTIQLFEKEYGRVLNSQASSQSR